MRYPCASPLPGSLNPACQGLAKRVPTITPIGKESAQTSGEDTGSLTAKHINKGMGIDARRQQKTVIPKNGGIFSYILLISVAKMATGLPDSVFKQRGHSISTRGLETQRGPPILHLTAQSAEVTQNINASTKKTMDLPLVKSLSRLCEVECESIHGVCFLCIKRLPTLPSAATLHTKRPPNVPTSHSNYTTANQTANFLCLRSPGDRHQKTLCQRHSEALAIHGKTLCQLQRSSPFTAGKPGFNLLPTYRVVVRSSQYAPASARSKTAENPLPNTAENPLPTTARPLTIQGGKIIPLLQRHLPRQQFLQLPTTTTAN